MKCLRREIMILRFKLFLRRKGYWREFVERFNASAFKGVDETLCDYLHTTPPKHYLLWIFLIDEQSAVLYREWKALIKKNTLKKFIRKLLGILIIGIIGGFLLACVIITLRMVI